MGSRERGDTEGFPYQRLSKLSLLTAVAFVFMYAYLGYASSADGYARGLVFVAALSRWFVAAWLLSFILLTYAGVSLIWSRKPKTIWLLVMHTALFIYGIWGLCMTIFGLPSLDGFEEAVTAMCLRCPKETIPETNEIMFFKGLVS